MKNIKIFTLFVALVLCNITFAQQGKIVEDFKPTPVNQPGREYPQVNSEGRVRTQIMAPDAKYVKLDIGGVKYDLVKDTSGMWIGESAPQDPGFHYYQLNIDGASVPDPGSLFYFGACRWGSGIEIPSGDEDMFAVNNVPHGHVHQILFPSKTTNTSRVAFVYTPPQYQTEPNTRFPVLYLQHGYCENETSWPQQGHANLIMDNLIAQGKAKPFIIVMTYGMTNEIKFGGLREFDIKPFQTVLVDELIPYVDANFRTMANQSGRAMAGLSMGSMETKMITTNRPEVFSHIGLFSGALYKPDEIKDKDNVKLVFQSCGSKERPDGVKKSTDELKNAGINAVWYVSEGTAHEFHTWRRSLYQFAQLLFK